MIKTLLISTFTILGSINPLYSEQVYKEMPQGFQPQMEVAACFIKKGDEILFLKRLACKPQGNTWAIPGGKSDEGETAEDTVIREIQEETGIEMQKQQLTYLKKAYISHSTGDFVFHIFEYNLIDSPQVNFNPKEHADYRWVSLDDVLEMSLIPGEEEVIELAYGLHPLPKINSYHFENYNG